MAPGQRQGPAPRAPPRPRHRLTQEVQLGGQVAGEALRHKAVVSLVCGRDVVNGQFVDPTGQRWWLRGPHWAIHPWPHGHILTGAPEDPFPIPAHWCAGILSACSLYFWSFQLSHMFSEVGRVEVSPWLGPWRLGRSWSVISLTLGSARASPNARGMSKKESGRESGPLAKAGLRWPPALPWSPVRGRRLGALSPARPLLALCQALLCASNHPQLLLVCLFVHLFLSSHVSPCPVSVCLCPSLPVRLSLFLSRSFSASPCSCVSVSLPLSLCLPLCVPQPLPVPSARRALTARCGTPLCGC